jgi:hypothetical protein
LKKSRRGSVSPIIIKAREDNVCILAFPGCDLELVVEDEIVVSFKHGDVVCLASDGSIRHSCALPVSDEEFASAPDREQFNKLLVDHMILALKGVANGPQVVASSGHFTDIIVKTLEELDVLANKRWRKIDSIIDAILSVKERLFSRLMSKDARR